MNDVVLHDYWRSSASYRVRIALNHLAIEYRKVPVNLLEAGHKATDYLALNPQGLVPTLVIDGVVFTQSLAIIEYLAELYPDSGILPVDPVARHRVRTLAYAIAMDIHPVCNMGVTAHVVELMGKDASQRDKWMQKFIGEGLAAVETMVADHEGTFCIGDHPTMADFCLIPQLYNARRWNADISTMPRLMAIEAQCRDLPAFSAAYPSG